VLPVPAVALPSRAFALVLPVAVATACGGLLAPVDGGTDASPDAEVDASDASDATAVDSTAPDGDGSDGAVACDYDAWDEPFCPPPAADTFAAVPPVISAAAGGFGVATFVASGPWASDPTLFMYFVGSSQPFQNLGMDQEFGNPQSFTFIVADKTAGYQGTFTVAARAGNIERTAQVTVDITSCAPWPPSMVCLGGQNCGFQGDGCGGLLSCGTCPAQEPYCMLGVCQGTAPTYCPTGQGLSGPGGECVQCSMTRTCLECTSRCVGLQDECLCVTGGVPPEKLPSGQ
jgi:hypothetical protein